MAKETGIEIKLSNILNSLKVKYSKQHKVGNYPVDFYLSKYKLSIQVDGCWVHNHEKCSLNTKKPYPRQIFQARRDKSCTVFHKYCKINLIRITECYLNTTSDEDIRAKLYSILDKISNNKDKAISLYEHISR